MNPSFELKSETLTIPHPVRYHFESPSAPREVIVLFHGYMERGEKIARTLKPILPDDAAILIPNGPFPVPIVTDDGFREAYAWYFYDMKAQAMIVPPDASIEMIKVLVKKHGLENLPVRLIGFSQGGFLAPYLAARIKNVKQVIAIGAGFPERLLPERPSFRLDAVHGTNDTVCPYSTAQSDHAKLIAKGWQGEFVTIPGGEHKITDQIQKEVSRLLGW